MFNLNDVKKLLGIIPFGKQNAINAIDIANKIGYSTGGNQVDTRNLIRFAIDSGCIILSSPKIGYWQTVNKTEIIDCIKSLKRRSKKIRDRANMLKNDWNINNPSNKI